MRRTRFDQTASRKRHPVAFLLLAALGVLLLMWLWYGHALKPMSSDTVTAISITVNQGMSASQVASELKEKDLIRSTTAFSFFAKRHGYATRLKAGAYVLHPSQSVEEMLEVLVGGSQSQIVVTIPEGYTVEDIDALLVKKGLIKPGELQECARTCSFDAFNFLPPAAGLAKRGGRVEGYLFADTYFVDPSSFKVQTFLERLLKTFQERVIDKYTSEQLRSKKSWNQIITMASIIEEETRTGVERPIVSGILWKRFEENMGLAVDASVRYIIDKPADALTKKDLEIDSPYNTRKYRGLPPGPIANPSLSSIEAALNPQSSPYYYYLHGNDGQIHYATTNDEHNVNRAKFL